MAKKIAYQEPADFIPKSIRKELGIGEFSKTNSNSGTKAGSKGNTSKKK